MLQRANTRSIAENISEDNSSVEGSWWVARQEWRVERRMAPFNLDGYVFSFEVENSPELSTMEVRAPYRKLEDDIATIYWGMWEQLTAKNLVGLVDACPNGPWVKLWAKTLGWRRALRKNGSLQIDG